MRCKSFQWYPHTGEENKEIRAHWCEHAIRVANTVGVKIEDAMLCMRRGKVCSLVLARTKMCAEMCSAVRAGALFPARGEYRLSIWFDERSKLDSPLEHRALCYRPNDGCAFFISHVTSGFVMRFGEANDDCRCETQGQPCNLWYTCGLVPVEVL
ncbi:hypothetical protein T440DRAFT_74050 [Plenodomus tracheiphilus IPT5]|uniref:Uncharacterized protein n=1 Tax=Plenodomus tracheiphilus IPT5 TaxID=1408161 RepID=A0A6A7B9K3_9PLEO|nr:hypothetical protein T440DRAFT_74050 [Plenodomus tracheiphilus IPT5]